MTVCDKVRHEMAIDLTREKPWTIEQAAQFMRCSRRTIERHFDTGLEWIKFGRHRMTSRAAINRYAIHSTGAVPPSSNSEHAQAEAELAQLGIL